MRNPNWTRDELIVALDFYLSHRDQVPDNRGPEIEALSSSLNRVGRKIFGTSDRDEKFRNSNGVHMKLMNFRSLDPRFTSRGRKGLTRGGEGDAQVWAEFADDPERCKRTAAAILKAIAPGENAPPEGINGTDDDDETAEASEGRVLTRMHRSRERNRSLVKKKLRAVLSKTGALACEVCGFDFGERYGELGEGFAECHHLKPVSELGDGERTRLDDLAVVCANCHRVIHRRRPWISVAELRSALVGQTNLK